MSKIRTDFNQFYVDRHMGRKLTYVPYYGACVVKAHLPSVSLLTLAQLCFNYFIVLTANVF